ncbi:MAG: segregation/condensation protein A [Patescibacteria group bacterium]|jgi:segregation and condensation protein A
MSFSVEQEEFSGPLGLLLELIDEQKLEITKVSLAKVTNEYLRYIKEHEVPSNELADFLLVASRLIYLKSRELMPYLRIDEEDAAAAKLEDQLRLYQEFIAVAAKLEERYVTCAMYARPFVKQKQTVADFLPAKNVSAASLLDAFKVVLKRLEPFFALQETSMDRVKSVEERMEEVRSVLATRANIRFRDIVANAGSKVEIVVSFLALLELLRRKHIVARQEGHGEEIHLERIEETQV